MLGPQVYETLKYVNLALLVSQEINLGVFSACHSLQFLYFHFLYSPVVGGVTLKNFSDDLSLGE